MIEIACKTCKSKCSVHSLLAAATQPCPACGELLMGELATQKFSAAPSTIQEPAAEADQPPTPQVSLTSALVGAVLFTLVPIALAVFGDHAIPWVRIVLGALAGVIFAPFLIFFTLNAAMEANAGLTLDVEGFEKLWTNLARAINERRYGKVAIYVVVFVTIGMIVGGCVTAFAESVHPSMIGLAVLGAAFLGAVVGLFCFPGAE